METTEIHFEIASPLTIQILDSLSEIEEAIVVESKLSQQPVRSGIRQIAQHRYFHSISMGFSLRAAY